MDTKNIAYVMFKSKSYNISMVSKEHKTCTIKKTKHLMELSVSLAIWEFHCLILYIKNQKQGHKISIKLLVYCNKKKTGM